MGNNIKHKINTLLEINHQSRKRAIFAVSFSVITAILIFVGVTMRLFETKTMSGVEGTDAYRLFTIESNVLCAICAILCIPYQIDGIRNNNYHMPKWIVLVLYTGVLSVGMTFLTSVFILTPIEGFYNVLLDKSCLFLHTICPILSIILFVFIACDHQIKFSFTFIGLIPIFIYTLIYIIMVFIIGKDNGGWVDYYRFNLYVPWPIALIVMYTIAFLIATIIRISHNKMNKRFRNDIKMMYQNCEELNNVTIEEAITILSRIDKNKDPKNNNITIPRRIFMMLLEKNNDNNITIESLCDIYLKEYLK